MSTAAKMAKKAVTAAETLTISRLNQQMMEISVVGTAPYMQLRFPIKGIQKLKETHMLGSAARKGQKRDPRDFDADYEGAFYVSEEGWHGVPTTQIRAACIRACALVNFKMTIAKMCINILPDGYDKFDGTPLIRLQEITPPIRTEWPVPNANGKIDIRVRPQWRQWGLTFTVQFDADQFTSQDILNLINRAGQQVGIGEGRPFSKNSAGIGMGTFALKSAE